MSSLSPCDSKSSNHVITPNTNKLRKNNKPVARSSIEYLQELLKDKKMLMLVPNVFHHVQRLLDAEVNRVRSEAFHNTEHFKITVDDLPVPEGLTVVRQEKVYVPVKDHPNYNFVGRLLGPAGMTAKQLEKDLGCKIMIRGKGSMRDKKKEEQQRGKPSWEHLDEELHVLISVEDAENRAEIRAKRAADSIIEFFNEAMRTPVNQDKLKQMQLMELQLMSYKNGLNAPGAAWFNGNPWLQSALLTAPGNPAAFVRPNSGIFPTGASTGFHGQHVNGRSNSGPVGHGAANAHPLHTAHHGPPQMATIFNGDLVTAFLNGYTPQILAPGTEFLLTSNNSLPNGYIEYGNPLTTSLENSSAAQGNLRHPANFALTAFPVSASTVGAPQSGPAMSLLHTRRDSP